MPLAYKYDDAYLAPQVTPDREARAVADVAVYGTFPAAWTERLVRARAYVITCQECQRLPDDLFGTKLAQYRREFDSLLPYARTAAAEVAGDPTGALFLTIPMERA